MEQNDQTPDSELYGEILDTWGDADGDDEEAALTEASDKREHAAMVERL